MSETDAIMVVGSVFFKKNISQHPMQRGVSPVIFLSSSRCWSIRTDSMVLISYTLRYLWCVDIKVWRLDTCFRSCNVFQLHASFLLSAQGPPRSYEALYMSQCHGLVRLCHRTSESLISNTWTCLTRCRTTGNVQWDTINSPQPSLRVCRHL